MNLHLVFLLCLLVHTVYTSSEHDHHRVAVAGSVVLLPCSFSPSDEFPTVEWTRQGPPTYALLYRDGCEVHEIKEQTFMYRTSLVNSELKNGNVSLRLSGVLPSDGGLYHCTLMWKNNRQNNTKIQLDVVAASEVLLSLVDDGNGSVVVKCDTGCWKPEPFVTFLDHLGNQIPTEDQNPSIDQNHTVNNNTQSNWDGCCRKQRILTLHSSTESITCRVHERRFNQTREAQILIRVACLTSHTLIVAVATTVVICTTIFVCSMIWWRESLRPALEKRCRQKQQSNERTKPKNQTLPSPPIVTSPPRMRPHSPAGSAPHNPSTVTRTPGHVSKIAPPEAKQLHGSRPQQPLQAQRAPSANHHLTSPAVSSRFNCFPRDVQGGGNGRGRSVPLRPQRSDTPLIASHPPRSSSFNCGYSSIKRTLSTRSADSILTAGMTQHRKIPSQLKVPTYNRFSPLREDNED